MTAPVSGEERPTMAVLTYDFPWPLDSGVRQRTYHIAARLADTHALTLITLIPEQRQSGEPECPLRRSCAEIIELPGRALAAESLARHSPWAALPHRLGALIGSRRPAHAAAWFAEPLLRTLREVAARVPHTATWVNRAHFADLAATAGFRGVIADLDDLYAVARWRELRRADFYLSKPLHYADLVKIARYERAAPRRFWRTVVCKAEDREWLGDRSVRVVPNGTVEIPAPSAPSTDAPVIVFTGTMDYPPNIDAARWFATAVLPLIRAHHPDAEFRIVGRDPAPDVMALAGLPGCTVTGAVASITTQLREAAIVVAPIRLGSGTRLKVLEAMMHARPLVATRTAIEGLDLRPGADLLVADDAAQMAASCRELLDDGRRARALGWAGRQAVLARFTWTAIAPAIDAVVRGG